MSDQDLVARRILAVTEEEFQRLILDIHDGPVQKLFAVLSHLTLLRSWLEQNSFTPEQVLPVVQRSIRLLEDSLKDIRDLLSTFRSPEFAASTVRELVENVIVQHETLTSHTVTLETASFLPEISLPVKIAFHRILQEALSNVRRHAGVSHAQVKVYVQGKWLVLEVCDQGRGFMPPSLEGPEATEKPEHIGLRGMRDRAVLVGGEFSVESQPGKGTCVRVRFPIYER